MKIREYVYSEAILNLADLLMHYGFKPDEAIKTAKDFWKKNKKKLEEVM